CVLVTGVQTCALPISLKSDEAWVCLFLAGCFEIAMVTVMKLATQAAGVRQWVLTAAFLLLSLISFGLLFLASRTIPIGTAYAIRARKNLLDSRERTAR